MKKIMLSLLSYTLAMTVMSIRDDEGDENE